MQYKFKNRGSMQIKFKIKINTSQSLTCKEKIGCNKYHQLERRGEWKRERENGREKGRKKEMSEENRGKEDIYRESSQRGPPRVFN